MRMILAERKGKDSMSASGVRVVTDRTRRQNEQMQAIREEGKIPYIYKGQVCAREGGPRGGAFNRQRFSHQAGTNTWGNGTRLREENAASAYGNDVRSESSQMWNGPREQGRRRDGTRIPEEPESSNAREESSRYRAQATPATTDNAEEEDVIVVSEMSDRGKSENGRNRVTNESVREERGREREGRDRDDVGVGARFKDSHFRPDLASLPLGQSAKTTRDIAQDCQETERTGTPT